LQREIDSYAMTVRGTEVSEIGSKQVLYSGVNQCDA
jgi:hypothetical protein